VENWCQIVDNLAHVDKERTYVDKGGANVDKLINGDSAEQNGENSVKLGTDEENSVKLMKSGGDRPGSGSFAAAQDDTSQAQGDASKAQGDGGQEEKGGEVWRPERVDLAAPASTRPPARTYMEQRQERAERLLGRYASLADLLGLERLPELDCRGFKRILDVGTREGNWAIAMARKHPGLWVLGIDSSPSAISRAESVAVAEGLCNIAFMVRRVEELLLGGFTVRHFNLVRLHCLAGEITPLQLPPLIHAAVNVCVRGGTVLWSELELPLTNSDPCERLFETLVRAMQRQKRGFGPGHTLGITPLMGVWLRLAGCRVVEDRAQVVEISAGTGLRNDFLRYVCDLGQQMRGFVVESGVIGDKEYDDLMARALIDIQALTFCGLCYARTILAQRESSRDPLRNKIAW
jgi:hypothetical protein